MDYDLTRGYKKYDTAIKNLEGILDKIKVIFDVTSYQKELDDIKSQVESDNSLAEKMPFAGMQDDLEAFVFDDYVKKIQEITEKLENEYQPFYETYLLYTKVNLNISKISDENIPDIIETTKRLIDTLNLLTNNLTDEQKVIVDEAYIDFGGKSAMELVNKYENVLVVQTFSKSRSMAGMRIGYCFGNPELIKALNDVKFSFNSYTMNRTSISYGIESVNDKEYFEECVGKIVKTRENAKERLSQLGFSFPDSKANFIFATHKSVPAKEIFEKLKGKNIFVRYFNQPLIDNYLRITIGTDEQMEKLYAALEEITGQVK